MKKYLMMALVATLSLGFASCGSDDDDPIPTPGQQNTTTVSIQGATQKTGSMPAATTKETVAVVANTVKSGDPIVITSDVPYTKFYVAIDGKDGYYEVPAKTTRTRGAGSFTYYIPIEVVGNGNVGVSVSGVTEKGEVTTPVTVNITAKGGNNNTGGADKGLVGTWELETEIGLYQLVLAESTYSMTNLQEKYEGTYTITNGVATLINEKYFYQDWESGEWIEDELDEDDREPAYVKLLLLKDSKVLILEFEEDGYTDFIMLNKKGATNIASNIEEIQGKWVWYVYGMEDHIRAYLEVNGNQFDLIIPAYSERYKGQCDYANGEITFDVHDFQNREWFEGCENPQYLYQPWGYYQWPQQRWSHFKMPFIVNDGIGYGLFVNLLARFEKQ